MMSNLQALADHLELQQLVTRYANAIDTRDWSRLDSVFTPDAHIDYRAMGGIEGDYPTIRAWLAEALAPFPHYLHFVGNFDFRIEGDTASGRVACINPMAVRDGDGTVDVMTLYLWYIDRYVRTPQGWRISHRSEEQCCAHNVPKAMQQIVPPTA